MNLKKTKEKVRRFLEKTPHLRDNDNALVAYIWWDDYKELGENGNVLAFLTLLSKGKLSNFESIRRCRQKLQELHPELRGDKYLERHKEAEVVKKDLQTEFDY